MQNAPNRLLRPVLSSSCVIYAYLQWCEALSVNFRIAEKLGWGSNMQLGGVWRVDMQNRTKMSKTIMKNELWTISANTSPIIFDVERHCILRFFQNFRHIVEYEFNFINNWQNKCQKIENIQNAPNRLLRPVLSSSCVIYAYLQYAVGKNRVRFCVRGHLVWKRRFAISKRQ